MRVHMKTVGGIVVTQEQFFETDRFSKLIHTTLRTINLNTGKCFLHNRRTLATDEARHCIAAALIIRDTPAGTEVIQVGVDLSTDSHGRSPDRALDGAALLDGENATAIYMTLRSMISGLQENYLICISFDIEDDITITLFAVWARVCDALETLFARIARIVMLSRRKRVTSSKPIYGEIEILHSFARNRQSCLAWYSGPRNSPPSPCRLSRSLESIP